MMLGFDWFGAKTQVKILFGLDVDGSKASKFSFFSKKTKNGLSLISHKMNQKIDEYKVKYYHDKGLKTTNIMIKDLAEWIRLKEGGLTDSLNDSASSFPVPGTYTKLKHGKQHTSSTWHTNKGVTYRTYLDSSKTLGYNPTIDGFFNMPNDLPFKLFKIKYSDAYAENSGSELIDYYLGSWSWGSGVGGEKNLLNAFLKIENKTLNQLYKEDKNLLFANLILYRIKFFENLAKTKPKNKVFLNGWINETLNFYYGFQKYL